MAEGITIPTQLDNSRIKGDLDDLKSMIDSGAKGITDEVIQSVETLSANFKKVGAEQEKNNASIAKYKEELQTINDVIASNQARGLPSGEKNVMDLEKYQNLLSVAEGRGAQLDARMSAIGLKSRQLNESINATNSDLKVTTNETSKSTKSMSLLSKSAMTVQSSMSKTVKTAIKWAGAMFGIRAMYSAIRQVFRAWVNDTQEGAQAQADLSRITSSMASLLGPLFQGAIKLLNQMLGIINAITMALFGFSLITKSNNKNMGGSVKQAKALNKEMKQLAGFDEMNVLSSSSSGDSGSSSGGIGDIVPSELPTPDVSGLIGAIQKVTEKLEPFFNIIKSIDFKPLQKSLENLGNSFLGLAKVIGNYFIRIMNETIGPFIKLMSEDIVPKGLDTIARVIERLTPMIERLLKEFVEPLFNWLMMTFVPVALNLVFKVVEALGVVLEFLIETFLLFWDNVGKHIAWLGGELLLAIAEDLQNILKGVIEFFEEFIQLMREGDPIANGLAFAIGLIVAGFVAWKLATLAVSAVMVIFNGILGIFNALMAMNPFGLALIAILAVIAVVAVLYTKWDDITKFFSNTLSSIGKWFSDLGSSIGTIFTNAWNSLKTGAVNALNGIKNTFSTVGQFFKDTFTNAWNAVKNVFSTDGKIFSGITDGIVSAFKSIVNVIIDGINRVVSIPFNAINSALRLIKGVSVLGIKPFSFLPTISVPRIPRLATGTYTTGAMTAMIGEDGREAVVPLQNNTEWARDFLDVLDNYGGIGGSNGTQIIQVMLPNGKVLAQVVNEENEQSNFSTNGRGVPAYG